MLKRYVQVPIAHLEPIFSEWNQAYEKGHLVNVFFMPYGDLLFRAMQFVDWMSEKNGRDVEIINFETDLIANPENLHEMLAKYKGKYVVLIAKRTFMRPDGEAMAAILHKWYALNSEGAILLHEGFPSEMELYVHNPVMSHKRIIHPIYPDHVAKEYCNSMGELFGKEIHSSIIDEVVAHCGGFPWLINDILRRAPGENLLENHTLSWKVEQIAKAIPSIVGIEKDLIDFGLKTDKNTWIPIMQKYFDTQALNKLKIGDEEVTYDGREYTHIFSPGERRILRYLTETNEVVNREKLGKQFWMENAQVEYSDWALDAIMSRLRKKIAKLGLPIVIKTKRGRGYELS